MLCVINIFLSRISLSRKSGFFRHRRLWEKSSPWKRSPSPKCGSCA